MSRESKFLSLVLRHKPEALEIELDSAGWVDVRLLLRKMKDNGRPLKRTDLEDIVSSDDKGRFQFSENGLKIRVCQGHSVNIVLNPTLKISPSVLYHGTARSSLESIFKSGLSSQKRQYVHLSSDIQTAIKVGNRHGKCVVLNVDCQTLTTLGHDFFVSDNGVWLTKDIPASALGFVS
jgi:putative RNA 2'-phosphotransferase